MRKSDIQEHACSFSESLWSWIFKEQYCGFLAAKTKFKEREIGMIGAKMSIKH